MMIPRRPWRKIVGTFSLLALFTLAAGCGKQRTNLALNKVEKLLKEAQNFKVEDHPNAKQQWDIAATQRTQAEQAMAAEDFKQSVAIAGTAVRSARESVNLAKQFEADRQKNEADHEVSIMNKNRGANENQDLYQEIIDSQQKMHEKFGKQRWVATIEIAQEIKQKVELLLQRLRRQAQDDLVAVKAERERLIDAGGQEHALIFVTRVDDLIVQIKDNIDPMLATPLSAKKDYLEARALSGQAMIDAKAGIVEAKKRRCEGKIDVIQRDLVLAKQLRAEYFVPDLWNACSDDFAKIIENFWKKEYDFVLDAADRLADQVRTLIYRTRVESATFQRNKLRERVTELSSRGVPEYLPGQLPKVEKKLEDASAKLEAAKQLPQDDPNVAPEFEGVESICQDAQKEANEIMTAFRVLADGWIRKARGLSNRARAVFGEMERIFRDVHPEYVKPIDEALEDRKKAIQTDLGRRLAQAQANVALAEVKHTAEDYRTAIELSRDVQNESTAVLATIYNVVAHNVLTEIADQVTRYKREGAPEYAKAEMVLTDRLFQEAVALRDRGEFQASASKAAQARAQLEVMIQTIEVKAAQAIEQAQAAVKESDATKTRQLRSEDYQRVQQMLNEAKLRLETTRLKDAILTAERAEALIREASREASRIWATQELERAAALLTAARESGADIHAVLLLRESIEDLDQARQAGQAAQDLFGQKKFDEARDKYIQAKDQAIRAAEEAVRAKFRPIDEAEAAIVEARSYEGWRHELPRLTDAILALTRSKDAMEAGKFEESHQWAQSAAAEARKITAASKKQVFDKRLEIVDSLVAEALRTGGRYYQPSLLASMARELDKLREQYGSQMFDSNAESVAEIEARLQQMIETMPNIVAEWIRRQRERVEEIEQSDVPPTFAPRITEAKKFLRFAEMDFKRGKYRHSYSNLLVGRRLVDQLAGSRAEIDYRDTVRQILNDLKQAMEDFDHFLSLNPKTLWGMTRMAGGDKNFISIAGRSTPTDFRERIDTMLVQIQSIEVPGSMKEFHAGLNDMLVQARTAAINYERLGVLSEYDKTTKREVIQKAYDLMQDVRQRRSELEQILEPRSVAAR